MKIFRVKIKVSKNNKEANKLFEGKLPIQVIADALNLNYEDVLEIDASNFRQEMEKIKKGK